MKCFLCLPSVAGAVILLSNSLLQHDLQQWNQASAAVVAFAVLFGGPIVGVAALAGALTVLRPDVRSGMKCRRLSVLVMAAMATFLVWSRFER